MTTRWSQPYMAIKDTEKESGLEKSPVQCSPRRVDFLAGKGITAQWTGVQESHPLTKSSKETSKKWPWASKKWELLAQRSSWNRPFSKYHNTLWCPSKTLHKHCFQLLLLYVPREIENNACAKFWRDKREYYGIQWYFFQALSKASCSVNFYIVTNCFYTHKMNRHFPSLINLKGLRLLWYYRYLVNYTLQNCGGQLFR